MSGASLLTTFLPSIFTVDTKRFSDVTVRTDVSQVTCLAEDTPLLTAVGTVTLLHCYTVTLLHPSMLG